MFYYNLLNDFLNDAGYPVCKDENNCDAIFTGMLRTDVVEDDESYKYYIEVPGFKKEDIDINLENGILKVSAKNSKVFEENEKTKAVLNERIYGEFARSFKVGKGLRADQIEATFNNGVLEIVLPKVKEEVTSTKVAIK
jgi:HSP20 family protein